MYVGFLPLSKTFTMTKQRGEYCNRTIYTLYTNYTNSLGYKLCPVSVRCSVSSHTPVLLGPLFLLVILVLDQWIWNVVRILGVLISRHVFLPEECHNWSICVGDRCLRMAFMTMAVGRKTLSSVERVWSQ